MWKSLLFLRKSAEKNGKSPCGMDVADGWKEKRRPVVLHIPVEIRRWNVEKKWKREADGSFGFPPVLCECGKLIHRDV